MSERRLQRVNELIQQELGRIILEEVPAIGGSASGGDSDVLITVTRVRTSPTLEDAKVWISVFPFKESQYALGELNKKIGAIQHRLNKTLKMRFVPKIFFEIDEAEEKAAKLEEIK